MNNDVPAEPIQSILLFAIAALPIADAVATVFLWRLFLLSRQGRAGVFNRRQRFAHRWVSGGSWLLLMLAIASTIITLVFAYFALLAARRIVGMPPWEGSAPISAIVLLVLGVIPIVFALTFYSRRSRGRIDGREGPPPFMDTD